MEACSYENFNNSVPGISGDFNLYNGVGRDSERSAVYPSAAGAAGTKWGGQRQLEADGQWPELQN